MTLASVRPTSKSMPSFSRRQLFFTLYVVGIASVATANGYLGNTAVPLLVPHPVQVVQGLLMVFVVPGLSLVCVAFPELQSWVERLLASVGISIAVATCAAVLIAALPMGFSRQPLEESLGWVAVTLSLGGLCSARLAPAVEALRAWAVREFRGLARKISIGFTDGAPKRSNPAVSRKHKESDVRRSHVVLRFSFDDKPADPRA